MTGTVKLLQQLLWHVVFFRWLWCHCFTDDDPDGCCVALRLRRCVGPGTRSNFVIDLVH